MARRSPGTDRASACASHAPLRDGGTQMPAQKKPTQASQPDDVDARLKERLDELERLKGFENATTFSGDQRESYGELSGYDQHPADAATETFQREMDESIR